MSILIFLTIILFTISAPFEAPAISLKNKIEVAHINSIQQNLFYKLQYHQSVESVILNVEPKKKGNTNIFHALIYLLIAGTLFAILNYFFKGR
jgi:hypothetical protein